jgi:hypothetical protein
MRALGLLLPFVVGCGSSPAWQDYTPPEHTFRCQFPGQPELKVRSVAGQPLTRDYAARWEDRIYAVSVAEVTVGHDYDIPVTIARLAQARGGKLASSTDTNSASGSTVIRRDFEIEVESSKEFCTGWLARHRSYLYLVTVSGPGCRNTDPDVKSFLESFQILDAAPPTGAVSK